MLLTDYYTHYIKAAFLIVFIAHFYVYLHVLVHYITIFYCVENYSLSYKIESGLTIRENEFKKKNYY